MYLDPVYDADSHYHSFPPEYRRKRQKKKNKQIENINMHVNDFGYLNGTMEMDQMVNFFQPTNNNSK